MKSVILLGLTLLLALLLLTGAMAEEKSNAAVTDGGKTSAAEPAKKTGGTGQASGKSQGSEECTQQTSPPQGEKGGAEAAGEEQKAKAPGEGETGERAAGKTGNSDGKKAGSSGGSTLERRWIIKEKALEVPAPPQRSPSSIKWVDEKQKSRCETRLAEVRESFVRARHYSIQGDSCRTAEHSKVFLDLVAACEKECPKGFLDENGYDLKLKRNLEALRELGLKRCQGLN